jgi:signal transduction histidine kinase
MNANITPVLSDWRESLPPMGETLSGRRLTELLGEVQDRIEAIVNGTRERMNALLRSVMAVSSGLDLDLTLRQITQAAIELVDAQYGALGVLAEDGSLNQFIFVDNQESGTISPAPLFAAGRLGPSGRDESVLIGEAKRLMMEDLADNPFSAGFRPDESSTRRFLGVPVFARGKVFGRLYLTEKRLGEGLTEDDEIAVRALAGAAGIAVENSRLYETGLRHRRWLEATAQVTGVLLGGGSTGDGLELIAKHAQDLAGADYTLIALPHDADDSTADSRVLTVQVCVGMGSDSIVGRTIPISGSTTGEVFADRIPQNVPRLMFDLAAGLGIEFGPALALPLGTNDVLAGVLLAVRKPGAAPFDELEMQMVSVFAGQAMLALERTEIQANRHQLQSLAQQDRIAKDLHDQVIQRLFAVGLSMEATSQIAGIRNVTDRLTDHVEQVYEVIAEIRATIFDLHSVKPAGSQLRTALNQLIIDLTGDSGVETTVKLSGQLDGLPVELIPHLQAVVSEAVSNVVRHAQATDLVVVITVEDSVVVEVTDNGIGISESAEFSGLNNLRARAIKAGGTFAFGPVDGTGNRLTWTAPVE